MVITLLVTHGYLLPMHTTQNKNFVVEGAEKNNIGKHFLDWHNDRKNQWLFN